MAPQARSVRTEIPDKLYFRIGEVSKLTDVKPYVLRYWESEFGRLKPQKSPSGQRRYTRADVELVLRIRDLLWGRKFTIAGARTALAKGEEKPEPVEVPAVSEDLIAQEARLIERASELQALQVSLDTVRADLESRDGELNKRAKQLEIQARTQEVREEGLADREGVLAAREQQLEARLRQAQEALAAQQADDKAAVDALVEEQRHELDMLRTRSHLLEKRAEEAVSELDEVRSREARMTRAMAHARRGIIEMRHRLHEAGKGGSS